MGFRSMYECFHCGARAVIWDCDYSFADVGYDGEGLVHICHCENCWAEIEYLLREEGDAESGTGPTSS